MINRKTLTVSSTIVILLVATIVLGWGIVRKTQLDASSETLVLKTIEETLRASNREAVLGLMSDENFSEETKDSLATKLVNLKRTVGALQSIKSIAGTAQVPLLPFSKPTTADYTLELSMLAGPIELTAKLVWVNRAWQFSNISFAGNLLLN